jgi:hypothetical protein
MVSSYLVCEVCGRFGPPASIFSEGGLRLCYQCWYKTRRAEAPPDADADAPDRGPDAGATDGKSDIGAPEP